MTEEYPPFDGECAGCGLAHPLLQELGRNQHPTTKLMSPREIEAIFPSKHDLSVPWPLPEEVTVVCFECGTLHGEFCMETFDEVD